MNYEVFLIFPVTLKSTSLQAESPVHFDRLQANPCPPSTRHLAIPGELKEGPWMTRDRGWANAINNDVKFYLAVSYRTT